VIPGKRGLSEPTLNSAACVEWQRESGRESVRKISNSLMIENYPFARCDSSTWTENRCGFAYGVCIVCTCMDMCACVAQAFVAIEM